ncbi:MAG: endopeptidase La, partial [Myxococcales bacterium]|nr:endopeptidase La [Myxococcales bacterium]
RDFLIPRQLVDHGLTPERLEFESEALDAIIDDYTHEAGVRRLEQQVASICRAVAVRLAAGEDVQLMAGPQYVQEVLGPPRQTRQLPERKPRAGVSTALAWTPAGGEIHILEASRMPGSGKILLTGQVGDVMREAAATAFTYVRANADRFGLPEDFLSSLDVHIHLPAASVPRDGAAAGLPILVAIASMLTRLRVRVDIALSGELTLRGNVLKVGGIKEKCFAAHRAGIRHIVLPRRNEPELEEVPREILSDLEVHFVSRAEEVLALALEEPERPAPQPAPL